MARCEAVQTAPKVLPWAEERRRFQRVRVNVLGRYMLPDRREYPCQVANMSPGGMALIVPVSGQEGARVIASIDHLGRLEGKIARLYQNGFAMTVSATPRKRDKLAAQLTWLANRHILNLPEDRPHGRIPPRNARAPPPRARNPSSPYPPGSPPPRPHPPPQAGPPACHAQWRQAHLPHHRPVLVGRRDHDRSAARDRDAGQPWGRAGPRGAPPRRRLCGRVHAGAASRLPGRERLRTVNAFAPFALKNAGPART